MHFCRDGGALVDRDYLVPRLPHEFHLRGLLKPVGCNRLRCAECGAFVDARTGWVPTEDFSPEKVFGRASWGRGALPLIKDPETPYRLYVCRCTAWWATSLAYLDPPDAGPDDERPPWRCDGHPALELPATVDGLELATAAGISLFLGEALSGWAPVGAPEDSNPFPGAWLNRLYAQTVGTPIAAAVSEGVVGALTSDDPLHRAAALHFITRYPLAPGTERLRNIARDDLELFHDVEDPTTELPLEYNLLRTLGLQERAHRVRPEGSGPRLDVIEFLRARVVAVPGLGGAVYPVLAEFDAPWLVQNLASLSLDDDDRVELLDWLDIYAPHLAGEAHGALYG